MEDLASYFKGLADENRLRILNLLFHGELCGCDIQYVLGSPQSNVSRHLSYLKNAGLVLDRRVGNRVYYSLSEKERPRMRGLFAFLRTIFEDNILLQADHNKLLEAIRDGECMVSDKPAKGRARAIESAANSVRVKQIAPSSR